MKQKKTNPKTSEGLGLNKLGREVWSHYPFREGCIKAIYPKGNKPKYGETRPLTDKQIHDIEEILQCPFDDLDAIEAFLEQECNVTQFERLTLRGILRRFQRYQHRAQEPRGKGKNRPQNRKAKRSRKKTHAQILHEVRERQAAQYIADCRAKNRKASCVELGEILECHKSTAARLKAWKNRGVVANEPTKGIMTLQKDDSYIPDGVVD